jgi:hypothetical protein
LHFGYYGRLEGKPKEDSVGAANNRFQPTGAARLRQRVVKTGEYSVLKWFQLNRRAERLKRSDRRTAQFANYEAFFCGDMNEERKQRQY